MSAAQRAASHALGQNRGSHPTTRLDTFLRSTDPGYQHAEPAQHGDRFVRKMATYGNIRPSVSFTSESRVSRPFNPIVSMDMSSLPPNWMDPRADPRELTLEYPDPPNPDPTFIKLYENQTLMLPSERQREHQYMKKAEKQWRDDKAALFFHKKQMRVLEREHPEGVIGLDGPLHEGTELYREQRGLLQAHQNRSKNHSEGRMDHLAYHKRTADASAARHYGESYDCPRSTDIPVQTRRVDPVQHPFRFLDTHDRIFPDYVPVWDPERASALRSHETRGKQHNLITGADNAVRFARKPTFGETLGQRGDHPLGGVAIGGMSLGRPPPSPKTPGDALKRPMMPPTPGSGRSMSHPCSSAPRSPAGSVQGHGQQYDYYSTDQGYTRPDQGPALGPRGVSFAEPATPGMSPYETGY